AVADLGRLGGAAVANLAAALAGERARHAAGAEAHAAVGVGAVIDVSRRAAGHAHPRIADVVVDEVVAVVVEAVAQLRLGATRVDAGAVGGGRVGARAGRRPGRGAAGVARRQRRGGAALRARLADAVSRQPRRERAGHGRRIFVAGNRWHAVGDAVTVVVGAVAQVGGLGIAGVAAHAVGLVVGSRAGAG